MVFKRVLFVSFHLVGYAASFVFIGWLVFMGLLDWRRNHLTRGQQAEAATGERRDFLTRLGSKADKWLMPALIAFAVILPMMPFADRTVVALGTVVLIYVMLVWGLNIVGIGRASCRERVCNAG